jgi:hypothetical protein
MQGRPRSSVKACSSLSNAGRRIPVVDFDVLENVEAGPLIRDKRGDSVAAGGLDGQRNTRGLGVLERAQGAVEDQPLTQLGREALVQDGTAALPASGRMGDGVR